MLRTSLTATAVAILGASTFAQNTAKILPVPGVKDAGTYHVATGTWTRGPQSLATGTYDVIYDNTCSGAWYTGLEQKTFHDDGRIPSKTSPLVTQTPMPGSNWPAVSFPGTNDVYSINWYQFAYCTGVAAPMTALTAFYECYTSCSDATLITPTMAIQISGLPGSPSPGVGIGCWTVSIDLLGATLNFNMQGDCDGSWDGSPALDYFGYMYLQSTPDPAAISGPILAGDPDGLLLDGPGSSGCCVGCGTVFVQTGTPGVPGVNVEGSGLNCQDFFEIDDHLGGYVFQYNGCYWYGGYSAAAPHADIHWEIQGETDDTTCGVKYCNGHTLSGNACPCGNDNSGGGAGMAGCAHGSSAAGATLDCTGTPSLSSDTLVLVGTNAQPSNSSMFFQAINDLDGLGVFLGDGIRCAGGNLKRIKVKLNDAAGNADSTPTVISDRSATLGYTITAGETLYYQWWFRDTAGSPCGNENNTSNGLAVTWQG